ncbi:hypothetical protein Y1Q_0000006 [Alligator mississippiensis]|uniref:C-type lectin domain-containing protein n=1 Tax=Alligator mississippiensis TaxID=8496 RepID=A0A151MWD1_ALLMI|nr:hypothetical protein Y1Q_0000006 [Alligator mississippiensis]
MDEPQKGSSFRFEPGQLDSSLPPIDTSAPEMSKETVMYADVTFRTPPEQLGKQRSEKSRKKDSCDSALAWRLIAGILGIFCLALLLAVGVLGVKGLTAFPCPQKWFFHGQKCYRFSKKTQSWLKSQAACSANGSRLLQTESKDELDLIDPLASSHWIGLLRDKANGTWVWENGSTFTNDQIPFKHGSYGGDCAVVIHGGFSSDDCSFTRCYICEKSVPSVKPDMSAWDGTWIP